MPWNGTISRFGWPFADHHFPGDELLASPASSGPRDPQRPAGAQACSQLAAQRPTSLNVKGLVDRLVRDPHRLIIGEVDPEPVGNLLRTPCGRPPAVLTPTVASADPTNLRSQNRNPARSGQRTGQPVLHILAQPLVGDELADLRTTRLPFGLPLRDDGPIVQRAAAGRRVAAQLPGDRRRRPAQMAGDLSDAEPVNAADRDFLTLGERQIAAAVRLETRWRHPASLTEPSRSNRR